jgi:DNA (cytosine-5)-methyltransferase 1
MLHLGDITKINGADVPTVNVIIGGSPCQDLSVAGKRAGLSGERSGLFMEQLRIIKEMRRKDIENGAVVPRPRYMVWENVPGAFSSNKGEDFRIVLEETAKVVEPTATIPRPEKGKWTNAGAIVGDGWSIAWRVLDAQFWGVPQRRRRIALVADFGGRTAPEILFERKSVSGNITQSGEQGQAPTRHSETGFRTTGATGLAYCIQGNAKSKMGAKARNIKTVIAHAIRRSATALLFLRGYTCSVSSPCVVAQTTQWQACLTE